MDPSALIFVALAVAWAVYLIPKALEHHDEAVRSRSVDRFSHTMRVLARREPVDRRSARLVVAPGRPAPSVMVSTKPSTRPSTRPSTEPSTMASTPLAEPVAAAPAPAAEPEGTVPPVAAARRRAAAVAARRRRRVLGLLLAATAVVVTLAAAQVIAWWYVAAPVTLLVAWLVACRLMVRRERSAPVVVVRTTVGPPAATAEPTGPVDADTPETSDEVVVGEVTEEISVAGSDDVRVVSEVHVDPTLWDPVPVTLPTYVSKPAAARRTVRTIDLDDTGVWTSGRSEADSRLAREAEEADRADRATRARGDDEDHRAVGS